MRCNDCNKFVSFGELEADIEYAEVDGNIVTGDVHLMLPCAECGTELKETTLSFELEIEHECDGTQLTATECRVCGHTWAHNKDTEQTECPECCSHYSKLYAGDLEELDLEPEYELKDDEVSAEPTDRFENVDKHGKTIKDPRYQKHYYGADVTCTVICSICGEEIELSDTVEEQASNFEEL